MDTSDEFGRKNKQINNLTDSKFSTDIILNRKKCEKRNMKP